MKKITSVLAVLFLAVSVISISSCSINFSIDNASANCQNDRLKVVVTVNQWASLVKALGGECVEVKTIISGTDVDPHEYEPTANDIIAFQTVDLTIVNGASYDTWADNITDEKSKIINIAKENGINDGDNPHIWYSPKVITNTAHQIRDSLNELANDSKHSDVSLGSKLSELDEAFELKLEAYNQLIESAKISQIGKNYAATESVANYLADALGERDVTPTGYANAVMNEGEITPKELKAFYDLFDKSENGENSNISELFYNTQEEDNITEEIRKKAETAKVKIIEVTEQMPTGFSDLIDWQTAIVKSIISANNEISQ